MSRPDAQARRATVEDLPQLVALWELEKLPAAALEKRFTEFQVVADLSGSVLAAIGLEIHGAEGRLHSDAIGYPEHADFFRELLWPRIEMVCRNHSVERLWTQMTVPFLRTRGFAVASAEQRASLPPEFGEPTSPAWQVLNLRAAEASNEAIARQFAMLKTMHQAETERLRRHARTLKVLALALVVIVSLIVVAWAVVVFRYGPRFLQRR